MRKRGRKPRIIVVFCPFFCYFIVQVQNVSSPLHNLICGLVHISEMVFPLYGVRFISITDNFDSDKLHGDTGGINVAFKYLVSEFYSRDLSIKYKSAKYVKFRRGEYQSKTCPYGYRKGTNGRMEPNEETAPVDELLGRMAPTACWRTASGGTPAQHDWVWRHWS